MPFLQLSPPRPGPIHRPALERYVQKPSTAGVLILDVKTFPETTKLAKALPDAAKIACKSPPEYKLAAWCVEWAKNDVDLDAIRGVPGSPV